MLEACPKNAVRDLFKFYTYLQGEVEYRNYANEYDPPEHVQEKFPEGAKVGCAGRGIRKLITRWYNRQSPYEVTYSARHRRNPSHAKIIKKFHVRGDDIGRYTYWITTQLQELYF